MTTNKTNKTNIGENEQQTKRTLEKIVIKFVLLVLFVAKKVCE